MLDNIQKTYLFRNRFLVKLQPQTKMWKNRKQKLLGVEIHSSLNFDLYVSSLCDKARKNCLH